MPLNPGERNALGRRLTVAAPKLRERLAAFHRWLPAAAVKVREPQIAPLVEGGRVIAVDTPLGRLSLAEEFGRREDRLIARIVFYRPAGGLLSEARAVYAVELRDDYMAYFDPPGPATEFEWDHNEDDWAARNVLRLGYELAIACSEA
ncbi:MAG TPA: hypothetical protein VF522_15570 [Ramlibacter sp.]|uniref:hypothetical protein n=1 Tax=Ramlibacter sp. TaxID=1917967 RepID=UPI002ED16550